MSLVRGVDAFLFDVGGTLVEEAAPGTPLAALEAHLLPGVLETLRRVGRHHRVAAVTNTATMREPDVRRLLAPVGLDGLLEVLVTSVDAGAAKPDPAPLLLAAERLGVAPGRCVYVGDLAADRAAAEAAGMGFVATDRGVADAVERLGHGRSGAFADACARVAPVDGEAESQARARLDRLTKPAGSLGMLEELGVRLSGIAGACPPPSPESAAVAVFAGDHGVVDAGVTPWPQEVTAQMVANFAAGGAAINVIARNVGATVHVVDVGVSADVSRLDGVLHRKVRPGTADLFRGPAMTVAEARAALDVGAVVARELVQDGCRLLVTGEMGIGNTTPAAALIAALTATPAWMVTGRGTGIADEMLAWKVEVVERGARRTDGWLDPISALSEIGGLEIAALAGFVVGGAAARVPVLIDGVITAAALLVADALVPGVASRCVAGHLSTEPGAAHALGFLGERPLLDLGMRLGEGTGGCLAVPVVQAAAAVLREMATFDQAAIDASPGGAG